MVPTFFPFVIRPNILTEISIEPITTMSKPLAVAIAISSGKGGTLKGAATPDMRQTKKVHPAKNEAKKRDAVMAKP